MQRVATHTINFVQFHSENEISTDKTYDSSVFSSCHCIFLLGGQKSDAQEDVFCHCNLSIFCISNEAVHFFHLFFSLPEIMY